MTDELRDQVTGTTDNGTETKTQSEEKTFTQEDVDRIVKGRLSRYADYEEIKAKAAKFDEMEEAAKSDLQKATERADELQRRLDEIKAHEEIRSIREEVSTDKNIPVNLLTGTTKEECEAQAEALLEWGKPTAYPKVKDATDPNHATTRSTRDLFAEWMDTQK